MSQTISRQLISSAGNNGGSKTAWSIGETIISTTQVHQGYQFPDLSDCEPELLVVYDSVNNLILCTGDILDISVLSEGAIYKWSDGSENPDFSIVSGGIYEVVITTGLCSYDYLFNVEEIDCELIFALPNVFTPNGDETNDRFIPIEANGIQFIDFKIVDRTGTLIFETNDQRIRWDGKLPNGVEATTGVYFFVANITDNYNKQHWFKGHITLLR